jgi:hypothetical protein
MIKEKKEKPEHKQKFEYWTVVLTTSNNPQTGFYMNGEWSTGDNFTISTVTYNTMVFHVNATLQQYAEVGWRLKNTLYIGDEVMLIFERFTDDYELYSTEVQRYIESE